MLYNIAMNFLGHAIFTPGPEEVLFGSVAGDFIDTTNPELSPQLKDGLRFHANLDAFFSSLPELSQSRKTLYNLVSHFQDPVLDICADHIIASRWDLFFDNKLEEFAQDIYAVLEPRTSLLTPAGKDIIGRLMKENWLVKYQSKEGLAEGLERISRRKRKSAVIYEKIDDIIGRLPIIEKELSLALPIVKSETSRYLIELGYELEPRILVKERGFLFEGGKHVEKY